MPNSTTPLVSIILLTYNQQNLVAEAVESLFAQTYSPLEIILSDDASTDNTFSVIKALADNYQGSHNIKLNRNAINYGICAHINTILPLTQGELVFCAAGDDISLPERCEKVVSFWLSHNKKFDLIATDAFDMGFNGKILSIKKTDRLENWRSIEDWFIKHPYIFGASHAWSRDLINRFGTIDHNMAVEDQTMLFRSILTGTAATISEPLIKHRRGGISQKEKYAITVFKKRNELIAANIENLEFTAQCIKDSKVLGQEELTTLKFKSRLQIYQMIDSLFNTHSVVEKIKVAFYAKQVSHSKKLRFLIYAAFPQVLAPYFFLKNYLNNYKARKNH